MTRTILLADDSLTIQKVVELTFADTEYHVVAQSSGEDLLQKLPEVRPDLVICDIIMPGKDGYEVCQEIKSDPSSLHIPVILLSGTFEPFDRDRALAAGCSEIITKPFEARKLVDCVERLIQGGTEEQVTAEVPAVSPDVTVEVELPVEPPMQTAPSPIDESPAAPEAGDMQLDEGPGLEFTDTGFADMETAAREQADLDGGLSEGGAEAGLPDEGLEFEFSDEHEAFGGPDDEVVEEPGFEAPADEPSTEPGLEVEAVTPPVEAVGEIEVEPPAEPFPEPGDETGPPVADSSAPFAAPAVTPVIPPMDEEEADLPPTTLPGEELPLPSEPMVEDMVEPEPESHAEVIPEEIPEAAPVPEPEPDFESDPVPPPPPADPELFEDFPVESEDHIPEPDPSKADTGPIEAFSPDPSTETGPIEADAVQPPPVIDVVAPPVSVSSDTDGPDQLSTATQVSGLSDDDIERIAHRLLELAADRIERIAWEVVPDMAEIVVRQRIRELESNADQQTHDPVP